VIGLESYREKPGVIAAKVREISRKGDKKRASRRFLFFIFPKTRPPREIFAAHAGLLP
jgi:hypothetical protein